MSGSFETLLKKKQSEEFFRFINSNPDKPWSWYGISMNPNITMEIINSNPDKPWNWFGISMNPNITMEMINSNPDKEWYWYWISRNPSITMEIINSNPDKPWNWIGISGNPFTLQNKLTLNNFSREWMTASRIKKWWIKKFWNFSSIGRKRLERSFNSLEYSVW